MKIGDQQCVGLLAGSKRVELDGLGQVGGGLAVPGVGWR